MAGAMQCNNSRDCSGSNRYPSEAFANSAGCTRRRTQDGFVEDWAVSVDLSADEDSCPRTAAGRRDDDAVDSVVIAYSAPATLLRPWCHT